MLKGQKELKDCTDKRKWVLSKAKMLLFTVCTMRACHSSKSKNHHWVLLTSGIMDMPSIPKFLSDKGKFCSQGLLNKRSPIGLINFTRHESY